MLRKLLGYDMRAQSRSAVPMFISAAIISVVCCALLYFTFGFTEADNFFLGLAFVGGFFGLGILAIVVLCTVNVFMSFARYYKSLFTDEGYLTMTIPVSTVTLLNAKILSSLIWCVISAIAFVLFGSVAIVMPTLLADPSYLSGFSDAWNLVLGAPGSIGILDFVFSLLYAVMNFISMVVTFLASITVGSLVVAKHKILSSIVFFYVLSFLESAVESIIIIILGFIMGDAYLVFVEKIVCTVIITVFGAVMYFINLHILKNKFNIE